MSELIGTIHVDLHRLVRETWEKFIASKSPEARKLFFKPLVSEKELQVYVKNWHKTKYRSTLKNTWMAQAKKRYERVQILANQKALAKN